ncbi:hypothetical protein GGF31_008865 [Allomyces arbusculus]|nr:hypothetical protein GGF31_008865 [Allomyces arbusculus]
MDDYETEQQNEVDVLKSIFFEEFIELESDNFRHYAVLVHPDDDAYTGLLPHEEEYIRRTWRLYLTVEIPEDYPTSAPTFSISRDRPTLPSDDSHDEEDDDSDYDEGADEDDDDEDNPLYMSEDVEGAALLDEANQQAASLAGEVVVYAVVAAMREKMAELARAKVDAFHAAEAERIAREEAADQAKFHGTPVTRERFLAWKAGFDKEMAAKAKAAEDAAASGTGGRRGAGGAAGVRLTGRQLFETDKTLVTSDAGYMGDDDESVDPTLFTEEELDQLADLNLEEEESGVAAMLMKDRD